LAEKEMGDGEVVPVDKDISRDRESKDRVFIEEGDMDDER